MKLLSALVMSMVLGFACAMMDSMYLHGLGGVLLCAVAAGAAMLAAGDIPRKLFGRQDASGQDRPPMEVLPYCTMVAALALLPFLFMGELLLGAGHLLFHAVLLLALCAFFSILLAPSAQATFAQAAADGRNTLGAASRPSSAAVRLRSTAACAAAAMAGWILGIRAYTYAHPDGVALHVTTAAFIAALVMCALLLISKHVREVKRAALLQQNCAMRQGDAIALACDALAQRAGLSRREEEVLSLLAQGRDASGIEEALLVSRNTVKTHMRNVYAKLDVHSRDELNQRLERERRE